MKFAIAAVCFVALALGVQSSVIPWGVHTEVAGHGLSYTAVSSPHVAVAPWGLWGHGPVWAAHGHGPAAVAIHESPVHVVSHGPSLVVDGHGPAAVVAAHGPAVVAHAPAVVVAHGHEGQYVAKTRGAVHTAPLAGHVQSVAAINAAPAPGTV